MAATLKLYNLNDDPDGDLHWDETTWLAVWAPDGPTAERMYREWYVREFLGEGKDDELGGVRWYPPDDVQERATSPFAPAEPGVEKRPGVLRLIGWSCEGDQRCDSCGLAEMDGADETWHVCRECGQCVECGHEGDCPEATSAEAPTP